MGDPDRVHRVDRAGPRGSPGGREPGVRGDGRRRGAARGDDPLGDDPLAAYRESGEALRAAFTRPGVLDEVFRVPAGTLPGAVVLHLRLTELLVHGWDLARATGRSTTVLPADLAEQELAFSRRQLDRMPPGRRPFAPPQPVADAAPAIDRLAALLGRPVTQ